MTALFELQPSNTPLPLDSPKGFRLVSTSVSSNSEAIQMFVEENAADVVFGTTIQPSGASFPKTHTEQNYIARIRISSQEQTWDCDLPYLTATFPMVQTLPGRNILVVAPRCSRKPDGTPELNARIFECSGAVIAEFCLGDGIEHVQTDGAGNIWAAYFDEGVFGNFGWGPSSGAEPIGSAGLILFDQSGKKRWEYQPPEGLDSFAIATL